MEEAAAASTGAAPSQRLKAPRASALRMHEAGHASTGAAPSLQAARASALRMEEAAAVRRRAAPLQLEEAQEDGGLHHCKAHGGGRRCQYGRLPQFSSSRRVLQIAREAVSAAGLLQASPSPVDALPSVCIPHIAAAGGRCGGASNPRRRPDRDDSRLGGRWWRSV